MSTITQVSEFAEHVYQGLSAHPKFLSSKYFYDDEGSRIFQEIMKMPEYYLTNSEFEILSQKADQIFAACRFRQPFNIIELGAGDGYKTQQFLAYLLKRGVEFTYIPIDISQEALDHLSKRLCRHLPELNIEARQGDYFQVLEALVDAEEPNLFLFLGSNIGNYSADDAQGLLAMIRRYMKQEDKLLIGFDLQKNPHIIARAYDDDQDITRAFNLNLLKRMNRELGAQFDLNKFDFYSHYNPVNGAVKSYLVSLRNQQVYIDALKQIFLFKKNELIYTELSQKYSKAGIDALAEASGFRVLANFCDQRCYFSDSLWTL